MSQKAVTREKRTPTQVVTTRIQLATPSGGNSRAAVELNKLYTREALRDSLLRGEAPFIGHDLYEQKFVLNMDDPMERTIAHEAALAWMTEVHAVAVYVDRGITPAMEEMLRYAEELGIHIEKRSLDTWKRG